MRLNVAHITGWLVIVVVTLAFIGEAYGSPTGAFEQWERSSLVRRGDGVGAGPRDRSSGGLPGSRAAGDTPVGTWSGRRGDYLEDIVRPENARAVEVEYDGESILIGPDSRGREAERELSSGGIWEDRDSEREAPSRPAWDEYGHDEDGWDR